MNPKDKVNEKVAEYKAKQGLVDPEPETAVSPSEPEPVKPVESTTRSAEPLVIVTDTDAYIHERMKSQPSTIEEIEVRDRSRETEGQHRLKLPDEVVDALASRNVSPRWLNKNKRAIDHALDVIGWTLVNRSYFPKLKKHLFTANGSIERGDSILAFIPQKRAEEIRRRPGQISRERVKSIPAQDLRKWEQRSEHHYKPDLGAAESDNEESPGLTVQPEQPEQTQIAKE